MSRNQIEDLLHRYSQGETTPSENELVERWLEDDNHLESNWSQLDKASKDQWLSSVFKDIQRSIHKKDAPVVIMQPRKTFIWRSIAAVAAVLIVFSALYIGWPSLKERLALSELNTLTTPNSQKRMIMLADSSQVWVNAGSSLKYPVKFYGEKREVWLSGEAYFDVHHDAQHPFIIHTGNLITTVLGTAFNIKEDNQLHTIAVTVTRGKVSVANGSKVLGILTPNQQITFNLAAGNDVQQNVDVQQVIAWQQSDLHFDDVSFADAARQLEQHFGIKISFANEKLKNCRFTGTSVQGESLDKILRVICAFNNATYKRDAAGRIIVDGKGCDQ
jgi:transmembrane sensor